MRTAMDAMKIATFFEEDHRRLDRLFEDFQDLEDVDFDEALKLFEDFVHDLKRHIVWEEDVLFPLLERKTSHRGILSTDSFRQEHSRISESLERLCQKLAARNGESRQEEGQLFLLLMQHNLREEEIFYPEMDKLTTKLEKQAVFGLLSAIPKERYQYCCDKCSSGQLIHSGKVNIENRALSG